MGNPVNRIIFNKEVKSYLNESYPEMNLKVTSVKFDFKQDRFLALAHTDSGVRFIVDKDYNGKMTDNLVYSIWMDEIKRSTTARANEVFGPDVKVIVDISLAPQKELKQFIEVPSYTEVSSYYAANTTIAFIADSPKKILLSDCFEMVRWLVQKKYIAEISFMTKKSNLFILIPFNELEKVESEEDLVKFMVK